jgi:hypothetical protein
MQPGLRIKVSHLQVFHQQGFFWHHACGHTDLSQNHGSFHFAASNLLEKHDNQRTVGLRVTLLAALRLFISPTQCRDENKEQ